ncbi:MAG: hypothetical protein Q7J57_12900 [Gemmobacter sp.]|nr:hypothetical protein [Gemmobacter sp.]
MDRLPVDHRSVRMLVCIPELSYRKRPERLDISSGMRTFGLVFDDGAN